MPQNRKRSATPSGLAAPQAIPDTIRETLNLKAETDALLVGLAKQESAVLMCAVAPYRSVRVSPVEEIQASIGLHEEFAFEAVIDEIYDQGLADRKILLLLNTFGGLLHSSFKVARALRSAFKKIEIYVPHIAASGGTLIALTGDTIIMGQMSQLSPLDPQVFYEGRYISALAFRAAYNRLCRMFAEKTKEEAPYPQQALADKLDPILMEDWNGSIETAEGYATMILQLANYGDRSGEIAHNLVYHFTEHDADLDFELAKKLGLRVEKIRR